MARPILYAGASITPDVALQVRATLDAFITI
jgi:hypothetical protein